MTATSRIAQETESHAVPSNSNGVVKTISPVNQTKETLKFTETETNCEEIKSISEGNEKTKKGCTTEEEETIFETTPLKSLSETSETQLKTAAAESYITLTGTITRGKKKGQNVDVVLNMSREELEVIESSITTNKNNGACSSSVGPHILLWSTLCFPFITAYSTIYSFYMGTLTWYNIFIFFSEEKSLFYKIFVTPFLILLYPFTIITVALGCGLYAGVVQLSWFWDSWWKEVSDVEKGFYGWLCNALNLTECSPYEVIILSSSKDQE